MVWCVRVCVVTCNLLFHLRNERKLAEQRAREEELAREEALKVDEMRKKWNLNVAKEDGKKRGGTMQSHSLLCV